VGLRAGISLRAVKAPRGALTGSGQDPSPFWLLGQPDCMLGPCTAVADRAGVHGVRSGNDGKRSTLVSLTAVDGNMASWPLT